MYFTITIEHTLLFDKQHNTTSNRTIPTSQPSNQDVVMTKLLPGKKMNTDGVQIAILQIWKYV